MKIKVIGTIDPGISFNGVLKSPPDSPQLTLWHVDGEIVIRDRLGGITVKKDSDILVPEGKIPRLKRLLFFLIN